MLEIHGSRFSQLQKKKRKLIKNTESITGKIKKYEGVHLYQQTLTVKMQPLPMKEWFCPHHLPNYRRCIKRDLYNQNNIPRIILQAVIVTDLTSAATISSSDTCILTHCLKLNYTKTLAFHSHDFLFPVLQKSSSVKPCAGFLKRTVEFQTIKWEKPLKKQRLSAALFTVVLK